MPTPNTGYARSGTLPLLLSSIALFHFGWLKFFGHGEAVYVMDWFIRLVLVALTWEALKEGMRPWYPVVRMRDWVLGLIAMYLLIKYVDFFVAFVFGLLLGVEDVRYFAFPTLEVGGFWFVDITFGLLLVALTEEVVYRKLFADLWREKRWRTWSLYAVSSLSFGLLHINQGPLRFPETALWGLLFMWIYRRTGSLAFVVLIHWLANIWYFGGSKLPYVTTSNTALCELWLKCVRPEVLETWPSEIQAQVIILGNL